ncbi:MULTISPECIES: amino acid transporter [unclassified Cryobacterium]|uniref:amino acid transporter n=1 Tax=unclassified Cryobacterium TaxID=2649013 RepID=UPI002AB4E826|nr:MULTISPECIES: amino acid transporter [unclassified Cryobacterium]MDY7530026.1 amino acid transporter [Cryobacterium sp. 10C2]MDY7555326.1 amino acid transporter [Cryobacterium sp. 10C3]MEB0292403.1 amino acid transporter [Cryobacterium sp. 10C2]
MLEGFVDHRGGHVGPLSVSVERTHSWWRVMCLTGVDYFSTLGYQPAIAALAAGLLSPIATIVLVALTLLGALPVYRRVAQESFKGSGSIQMLERLLPWWAGKLLVLVLLGFAATDFMITITLSAADATAHAIENPFAPSWLHGQEVSVTLLLVALLGVVFLRGFKEAIGIAVVLVVVYLFLNLVVILVAIAQVAGHAALITDWWAALTTQHGNPLVMVGIALIVFPKLALGLSGFETGVAVMPQVTGDASDTEENPAGRIRGTKRLLTTAALIMSGFLITSSIVTTLLIPQNDFQPGGPANGRALAYLAHEYLGPAFGSVYDISTICILWFAGASAMAGLLNLVPRYLPRYGMAPQWARAVRPLVLVFISIAFLITVFFQANVDAQGGAYATGVLVLMTSASVAVTLSARHMRQRWRTLGFSVIALILAYTTVANVFERPDGVRIAGLFILAIMTISILSRVRRSFELRATSVALDANALDYVMSDAEEYDVIRIISHEPDEDTEAEYRNKSRDERRFGNIPPGSPIIFLEVHPSDSSDFEEDLLVRGVAKHGYRVLQVTSGNVPNTIASVLLEIRDQTGLIPEIYFEWTQGNPISNMFKFLITGLGEIAPVTREVLRESEPNAKRRPHIHVS